MNNNSATSASTSAAAVHQQQQQQHRLSQELFHQQLQSNRPHHRHFHGSGAVLASQTPNVSRPPSRPNSPAPLIGGGGGLPDPGPEPLLSEKEGANGFIKKNKSGVSVRLPNGGSYVLRMSPVGSLVLHHLVKRWKSVVFFGICLFVTIMGLNGSMYSEWREITYYRVDPYPVLPHRLSDHGTTTEKLASTMKPVDSGSKIGTCPGPKGKLIPRAPLQLYPVPDTHPIPMVGDSRTVGIDDSQCLTYRGRYSMYTDDALGITYRRAVVDRELQKLKQEAISNLGLKKGQTSLPTPTATGVNVLGGNAAANISAGASSTSSSSPASRLEEELESLDPLMGRRKPKGMREGDWERILREELWKANEASELLGPDSFPDWRALMDECFERRQQERGRAGGVDAFRPDDADPLLAGVDNGDVAPKFKTTPETKRSALVLRSYEGYPWREDDILNLRGLISELSLNNPNTPYDIRILVEVKGQHLSVFTSEWDRLNVLRSSVPREFWGITELWTESELCALYPGLPGKFLNEMIAQTSYRSCLMALQKFWIDHQEYDFVWNWELDVRYIGNYLDFFEGVEDYARKAPLDVGMTKYDSWWVRNVTSSEENWKDDPTKQEGRGEEADLITLAPIFDPIGTGWYWEYDVQNYPKGQATPRRASIGTNMRMSRSLLEAMNVVNAEAKKSLHCEAWPTTLVLHSHLPISHDHSFYPEAGFTHTLPLPFKGIFVPHPIYFRHFWDAEVLDARINRPDFYRKSNERVMRDSSFYYDGAHSKEIYMGWKERDDVCRLPQLLHPIKRVN